MRQRKGPIGNSSVITKSAIAGTKAAQATLLNGKIMSPGGTARKILSKIMSIPIATFALVGLSAGLLLC